MRLLALALCFLLVFRSSAHQITTVTPQRDPAALTLARLSVQALVGDITLIDATLQGTANLTVGGDQESGSFTLETKGNKEAKIVLNLSGGSRQEIRQNRAGAWVGIDGQKDAVALHNCWVDASWALPVFTLQAALGNPQMAAVFLGQTAINSITTDHIQFSYIVPGQGQKTTAVIQGLSTMDLYLDSTSHVPVTLAFSTHPEDDFGLSIPVVIQFSGYRQLGGIEVPTRVQKLLEGTVTLDLTIANFAVNTGIPDSEFNTQ